jgi:hypothetical protein
MLIASTIRERGAFRKCPTNVSGFLRKPLYLSHFRILRILLIQFPEILIFTHVEVALLALGINGAGWQMSRRETDSIVQIFIKLCLITPLKIENNPLLRVRGCESGLRWLQPSVCGSCSITDCHRWQAIVVDSKFTTDRCMHRKYAKVSAASDAQWHSVKSMHRADRALIIFLKRTCHMTTCLILMISLSHSASIRIENIC